MAQSRGTSTSVSELKTVLAHDKSLGEINFAKAEQALKTLCDVTANASKSITSYNKERIRGFITGNIGGNESGLRDASRYLYYRSQVYYKLCHFYADMLCLDCRQVIPRYSITKEPNMNKVKKQYSQTLDFLDVMNLQCNWEQIGVNCWIDDVCYALFFHDDTGSFFYILNPSECKIETIYYTGDYGFAIDMGKWQNQSRQRIIEYIGEPLASMFSEYKATGQRWQSVPDEYAACFKVRTDDFETVIPPFITLMVQVANLIDLVDVQAVADAQQIYKLIYFPMEVLSGAKSSDDFEVSPDLMIKYFNKFITEALPDYVSSAIVPGGKPGVIDFANNAATDTNSVEQSQSQILATAGGGFLLDANRINSNAALQAALKAESEFAISTLLPQIQGFTNRMLALNINNPCKVKYFPVTIYTKDDLGEKLLKSCQYSFANRLAYNTFLGISEKATLSMLYLENDVLGLPDIMKYPLSSSFTQSGTGESDSEGGRPQTPDSELTPSGERSRNA